VHVKRWYQNIELEDGKRLGVGVYAEGSDRR